MTLIDQGNPAVQWGVVLGASLAAAAFDLRSRRIPNLLTGPVFLAGLAYGAAVGGVAGALDGFAAAVLMGLPYVLLFVFAGGGAGDAKLMGALGAWLGVTWGLAVLFTTCLAGAVLAIAWAHSSGRLKAVLTDVRFAAEGVFAPITGRGRLRDLPDHLPAVEGRQTMPYGVAILCGVVLTALGVLAWPV